MDRSAVPSPGSNNSQQEVHDRASAREEDAGSRPGTYVVGDEIGQGDSNTDGSPATHGSDPGIVVGENAGIAGDSDAMTAGDSADPRPDDSAARDP